MLRALLVVAFVISPIVAWAQPTPEGDQLPLPPPDDDPPEGPAAPVEEEPAQGEALPSPPTAPPAETTASPLPDAPVPTPEDPPPSMLPDGWRVMLSDLTIFRLNPIGLETRGRLGVQKKLYRSQSKVTENNFFFAGLFPKLNPASAQLGIGGELQPASIFNVRVLGEVQQFFGTFGFLQSFTSANVNYSDHQLSENKDNPTPATEVQSTQIFHVSIQPMLQLKIGPVAMRSLLQLDYWDVNVRNGDVVAYEPTFDTLLPDRGWTLSTDTDLLYVTGTGLAAGLRHTWVRPLYTSKHFTDAADQAMYGNQNAHQRLGFFGAYTLKDHGPSRFNKPTLILIVSFYLNHKYRTGEPDMLDPDHTSDDYRTRLFPYVIAGFAFESDFIRVR